jgi:hypothetical protein
MAANRLSVANNELYIGKPYFTEDEAARIRSALIGPQNPGTEDFPLAATTSVQDAIQQRLADFFNKRRASGDARPCGPHDMVPVYTTVFGIDKRVLKDENFLGRLRRSGLEGSQKEPAEPSAGDKSQKKGKRK